MQTRQHTTGTEKMGDRTIFIARGSNTEQQQLRHIAKRKTTTQIFRLSMLDTSRFYGALPQWANTTLYKVNVVHNKAFNPMATLYPNQVSDYLIKAFNHCFEINQKESLAFTEDKVVVSHSLNFDFYHFDIRDITKLKRTAKPLYIAFVSLINSLSIQYIENDMCCFMDEFINGEIQYTKATTKLKKAKKELEKGKAVFETIKNDSVEIEKAIKIVKAYKGRKNTHRKIASFLTKWLGVRFFFLDVAPFQFYQEGENHDSMDEHCELPCRVGFYATKGKYFQEYLQGELDNVYSNQVLCDPAWIVDKDNANVSIRENIKAFEEFTLELLDIMELV